MRHLNDHKNLILITSDSLRADYVSFLCRRKDTPYMAYLAKNGCFFSRCFSASSMTFPSFTSIFTSLYPSMYPFNFNVKIETIASRLASSGYITIGLHSNPYLSRDIFRRGFFIYKDLGANVMTVDRRVFHAERKPVSRELIRAFKNSPLIYKISSYLYNLYILWTKKDKVPASLVIKRLKDLLNKYKNKPFFAWVHFMDTHYRYDPPIQSDLKYSLIPIFLKAYIFSKMKYGGLNERERQFLLEVYMDSIKYVDYYIGQLINYLDEGKLLDKTYIIVTADHGEEFGEHGDFGHFKPKLYNEMIHVPLIIYGPDLNGIIVKNQVSLIDLAPTIVDLLQLSYKEFLGRSMLPLIKGEESSDRLVISEIGNKVSYLHKGYKCIADTSSGRIELYNLRIDPKETSPIHDKKLLEKYESKIQEYLLLRKKMRSILIRKGIIKKLKHTSISK